VGVSACSVSAPWAVPSRAIRLSSRVEVQTQTELYSRGRIKAQ